MAASQGSWPGCYGIDMWWDDVVSDCVVGWAYSCPAASGRSRASRRLNEPPIIGLAPTWCQARGGQCHEVRVLLGAGGHCGKIDSAKLSVNKQHSLYSCVVLYNMVVEPLTIFILFSNCFHGGS